MLTVIREWHFYASSVSQARTANGTPPLDGSLARGWA
jgi:hypothetical protein